MHSESVARKWLCCSALLVLLCQLIPESLQYDRQAPVEFWRFYTSHFVHWDVNHLCWDLLLYISLSLLVIKEDARVFVLNLLVCPWVISAVMWIVEPEMLYYRGISGLDAALFSSLAILWVKNKNKVLAVIGIFQLVLMLAKIIYELKTAQTIFTSSQSYIVVPWAHLVGAITGCMIAFMQSEKLAPTQISIRVE